MLGPPDVYGPNALVKQLRAPTDPPQNGGPSKIKLATQVLHDDTTRIPHKEAIIKSWLEDSWASSDIKSPNSSLLDESYHDLMLSITNQTGLAISPRWLGRLFESLVGHPNMLGLTRHAVWVSGLPAVTETAEAWVEVWIAMVSASAAAHGTAAVDEHLWQHVTRRLLETSGNGSAAKKVRTSSFDPIVAPRQLTQQIPPGLSVLLDRLGQVVQRNIDLDHMTLSIILFPAAALRTGLAFQTILDNAPRNQSTLFLLPKLLESYRHAMYQNRHDIFIQPTSSKKSYDSYLNEKLRETLKKAMLAIEPLCVEASGSAARTTADVWSVKSSCWKAIARYGVYLESDEDWHRLLSQDAAAARHLLSGPADPQVAKAAISFLAVAETLDHMAAAVDATTYAWCLASSASLRSEASSLLINTSRYYQLSQTPARWFQEVLNGIHHLVESISDRRELQQIHRLLSHGPLWDTQLRQSLLSSKTKQATSDMLCQRTRLLCGTRPRFAIALWVIARWCDPLFLHNAASHTDVLLAMESVYHSWLASSMEAEDRWLRQLARAAVVRVGRTCTRETRLELARSHEVSTVEKADDECPELRRELCLFAAAQLADQAPLEDATLDLLVALSSDPVIVSLDLWSDPDAAAVLHHFASPGQLETIVSSVVRQASSTPSTTISAELLELPGLTDAILAVAIRLLAEPSTFATATSLILSLPKITIDQARRSQIVAAVIQVDRQGDTLVKRSTRAFLAHVLNGSSVGLEASYWTNLQESLRDPELSESSAAVQEVVIASSFDNGAAKQVLDSLEGELALGLGARVIVQRERARLNESVKEACSSVLDRLRSQGVTQAPAKQKIALMRLTAWCNLNECHDDFVEVAKTSSREEACEIARLACRNPTDKAHYLRSLVQSWHLLPEGLLEAETTALLRDSGSYNAMLSTCLSLSTRRRFVEPALTVLVALLGSREEGSGKSTLRRRESIVRLLVQADDSCEMLKLQVRAIHALVKYRSKLLRVSDAARLVDHVSRHQGTQVITIFHTVATSRPELAQHLLPQMVQLVTRMLDPIVDQSIPDLAKLLTVLCQYRRRDSAGRENQLAAALGKHAPAMLRAYVRGLANPRTELSASAKRHLQASMYLLCDLVVRAQHRGREGEGIGLPYGIGEGGEVEKELWASLWTQWSKQRYKGQG